MGSILFGLFLIFVGASQLAGSVINSHPVQAVGEFVIGAVVSIVGCGILFPAIKKYYFQDIIDELRKLNARTK